MRTLVVRGVLLGVLVTGVPAVAYAQIGAIVAPGPLSRAHAPLLGVGGCVKCHDPGRKPTVERCLVCHKPIAQRIARKTGVHRAVTECSSCHREHRGADVDLRRFDEATFDHAAETGFTLDGGHAATARKCSACHKQRSFLAARPACASCHTDTHKGQLGTDCARCHSTRTPFKETRKAFDHDRTPFLLTGAHRKVDCAKCHVGGRFKDLRYDLCSACHRAPHRHTLGPTCTTCHNTGGWTTKSVDHGRTGFRLEGAHTQLACAKCHTSGVTTPLRGDKCSACHVNVHRDSVKEDCRACHDERGFRGAAFDHRAKTPFALVGKHEGLPCRKCHATIATEGLPLARQVVDFGGLKTECATCHEDKHKGEFGRACEVCHRPTKFNMTGFAHPRSPEFFADQHSRATCVKCHVSPPGGTRVRAVNASAASATPSMECRTCHNDAHLGQLGDACDRCHTITAPKFAAARFSHERSSFALTGRHQALACVKCHPTETRAFPGGTGTAMRVNPMPSACRECHKDPHLGQVEAPCNTCHTTVSFSIFSFKHTGLNAIFNGIHQSLTCQACHKRETGAFPAGHGTAVRFKVSTSCVGCHPRL
jgi:hypothetical protein